MKSLKVFGNFFSEALSWKKSVAYRAIFVVRIEFSNYTDVPWGRINPFSVRVFSLDFPHKFNCARTKRWAIFF